MPAFEFVNPDWIYMTEVGSNEAPNFLYYEYKPSIERWMAYLKTGTDFRLLTSNVVVACLNDAIALNLPVTSFNPTTGQGVVLIDGVRSPFHVKPQTQAS